MDYKDKSDSEIIALIKSGDTNGIEVIIERYNSMIKYIARSMFLIGGDVEDLIQEGTLGLLKAISSYNGKSTFKSYAFLCIKSKIISAIRKYDRKKNLPLKNYISFSNFEDENGDKNDIILSMENNPEDDYINKESVEELKISIKEILSNYEYNVLSMYLLGNSLEEISAKLNKDQKSIENAINRIRKKISKLDN